MADAAAAMGTALPRKPIEVVAPAEGPTTAGGKPDVEETVVGVMDKEEVRM